MNRAIWVDIAKGLGILLVVLTHVIVGVHDAGLVSNENLYDKIYDVNFTIHMPLFFFLSGLFFLPSLVKKPWLAFIGNKASTILYPYAIWVIIQGIIMSKVSNYTNSRHDLSFIFDGLLSGHAGHFWFLYTLFIIFFIASILFKIIPKISALIAFLITSLGLYFFSYAQNGAFNINVAYLPQFLIYFALGILFNEFLKAKNIALNHTQGLYVIGLFLVLTVSEIWLASLNPTYPHYFHPIALITSLIAIATFCAISIWINQLQDKKIATWLKYLGERSIYIYLLHVLAVAGTRIVLLKLFHIESVAIHLVIQMITGIAFPLLFYEVTQKLGLKFFFEFPSKIFQNKQTSKEAK